MKNRTITDINKIKSGVVYKADYFDTWKHNTSAIILVNHPSFLWNGNGRVEPMMTKEWDELVLLSNNHIVSDQRDGKRYGYTNSYDYGTRENLGRYIEEGKIVVYDNITDIKQIEII